ncbi:hypothetical protein RFI_35552 [Reticulomyxa filosa]|uniref:Uncharacterized protein n=1 Tax=Reticulomyxa filosa TaxID=46433 RepID=X6LKM5_RETFI|nr:hypothetical protein RFI_35552 [Reticulomyxa filosa]|eukprot:ETO01886.1 hypothetical protein RFI_35552 [Reticulomyxa filosa]
MLLILTFDEIQNAFQRKWDCKRVEDYAKVSHFEQDVKQFFAGNSDMFILRYLHKNSEDLTQFFQIKWILETAHASYYKDNNNEKKYEDEEKDRNTQKSKRRKLIVLIVRSVHKLEHPFPVIFTKKWEMVFVDSLTYQSSLSLQELLQSNQLTMMDDPSSMPMLKKNLQRAFYYLKLPSFNALLKIKHGFGDFSVLPKSIHVVMIERLKKEVNKMMEGYTICELLGYKKLQLYKNGSFIQNYENTVDSLITKGWTQALLALCENCYLENLPLLTEIFLESPKDEQLVPTSNYTNALDRNVHFSRAKVLYKAKFPFSWNFHVYNLRRLTALHICMHDFIFQDNAIPLVNLQQLLISIIIERLLCSKAFHLLDQCEVQECAMYTNDIIRGTFHSYLFVHENDDISNIATNIVFSISKIITNEINQKINISMIEMILLIFEDLIRGYIRLLTLTLSKYFLWNPSQQNDVDFPRKIRLAYDALPDIAIFLREICSKEKEYQEFLSVYRQIQMKHLGLKHFWTIDCYSISLNENLATHTLALAKQGFATENALIDIVDLIINSFSLSVSLMRKVIYFIQDLLYIVQQALENIIVTTSSQQRLLEKHCKTNVEINRMFEKMFMNLKTLELDDMHNSSEYEKNRVISKLKAQLTKHIYFLCENAAITTGELSTCDVFKSTLDKISDGLSYFKSRKIQFGNDLDMYEQYLHIWFLKQCCMLKGPCWTQNFFTQSDIRKKYPIFASETQSCVFSELKPRDKHTWLETPFDKAFANKYHNFKKKLSSIDTIKNCVITEKEDFVPFLIAALFVASDTSLTSPLNIQAQLLSCNIVSPGSSVACITNLLDRNPADTRSKMFYSSNAEDTTHPIVAKLFFNATIHSSHFFTLRIYLFCFTLLVCKYKTMTVNPFTILLNNPGQYENQRLPGESSKNGDVKISTFSLYYCRNGHALLMKKRGTVRRVTKCTNPWCSAKIDEPALLAHQTNIHFDIDNRYVLCDPNVNFDLKSQLDISPVICGLLQLLNSLTMLLRDVSELKGCLILVKLLQNSDNITEILWRRAKEKFVLLCKMTGLNEEQLSIALHRWLCEFGRWYNQAGPEKCQVVTPTIIHNFEKMFEKEYISYFSKPEILESVLVYDNEISHIIREKKEEMIFQNDKEFLVRNLFLMTRRMSSEELLFRLCDNIELANKYPLLFNTLKIIDKLECLQSLSSIGQWMKYCYMEYSGRLTYRECQNTTMNTIISNCHDLHIIQEWQRFKQCWNVFVNERANIGSAEIKIPKLSDNDKEVSFNHCTAYKNTPGLFIVAIVEMLQDIHNNLLKNIGSYRRKSLSFPSSDIEEKKQEEQKYDDPTSIVISKSLFDITNQDVVYVDKEEVDGIIRSWYCPTLEYGQNYRDEWVDFESIENEIYDRSIVGRHEINISIAMFEYANELTIQSILDNLDRCYPSFKKCTFNSNELEFIQSFFDDPQQAQHVFEITYQIIVLMDHNINDLNMLRFPYNFVFCF